MIKEQIQQVKSIIQSSITVKQAILADDSLLNKIQQVAEMMSRALQQDGKIWFCGNGGSAADAQHIAAEFTGRFLYDRPPLFAEALHVNTSYLTAVGNDYGYDEIYARLVQAKCRQGDVLVVISTSGNSANIIRALEQATKQGIKKVAWTGKTGGKINAQSLCDVLLNVPSTETPRIQEAHIMIGHILCELVEQAMFPREA